MNVIINALKYEGHLKNILKLNFYLKESTALVYYNDQFVNAV
jgi:hypothetical protein